MAHILKAERNPIERFPIGLSALRTGDELSYAILVLARQLAQEIDSTEVLGAIEKAKQEFYRLHVAKIEDQRRFEEGDVLDLY